MPQLSYSDPLPVGRNGQCYDSSYYRDCLTLINSDPQAAQIDTITVSAASNNTLYSVVINGISCDYLSDGSATQQEIADGLVAAINDEPAISGLVRAVSGTNAFTITARLPGLSGAFVTSESSGDLSLANTVAAANAAAVPFGRAVVRTADRAGRLIGPADFVGSLAQFSFTASNSQIYSIGLRVGDVTYAAVYTADGSATATEIATGLAAAVTALAVGLTGSVVSTDNLRITAADGVVFSVGTVSAGTGAIALVSYTPAVQPEEIFVAELTDSYDSSEMIAGGLAVGLAGYPPNRSMNGVRRGRYIVPVEEACAPGDPVYVRLSANGSLDDIGVFRKSANTGAIRLDLLYPNLSWNKGISASQAVLQLG